MSKHKVQPSKKSTSKNRWMQITVVMVIIISAGYFIFSNFISSKKTINNDLEKAMNNKTVYTFSKEGELSFNSAKGQFLTKIDIEIADSDERRTTGLMFRDKMNENQGMLFVFPAEEAQSFWMHNTALPLDIIYANSKMEIVKIHQNAVPYSDKSLPSEKPAQYVVEVNAGYCTRYNINEGDKIVWRRE